MIRDSCGGKTAIHPAEFEQRGWPLERRRALSGIEHSVSERMRHRSATGERTTYP